ncbi:HlyD family secretion protein [Fibrivirga algicola]|uniref:HlyD family secretion protein n=1 Tax=Fibrivirga algicola TaxID=2950420 RepID=A0ABX0QET7_9BACT|nr:HlyD family secretion protein [Fibrivirga algicola]ARK09328.1 secretion protein HlyD [Fibrella sp. ES10-3-2-2]NID08549.1 HlyD family secretion protein [Fibrivirga algicola]
MNKTTLFRVGGLIILAVALVFGYSEFSYLRRHETTDDAQIDGDVNPVIPKAGGYVKAIRFKDNQFVKEGDTLVVLDDADYRIRVAQAEAALQSAMASAGVTRSSVNVASATIQSSQAGVQTARNQVATAQANVTAAQARARRANQDFERYSRLLAEKTIPQQQFDAIQAERDAAQAQLLAAQAQLQTAQAQVNAAGTQTGVTSSQRRVTEGQISVAQATVKQRQTELDMANLQLSYTVVRAPISGIVSKRSVQVGQLVQPGQALCSVVGNSTLWVTANFKETQLKEMKPGQPVEIDVDAFDGQKLIGHVGSFAGATGAKFTLLPPDNATGNYVKVVQRVPVRIELDKTTPLIANLRPGMSATVAVDLQK